jgi:hypothetical protein
MHRKSSAAPKASKEPVLDFEDTVWDFVDRLFIRLGLVCDAKVLNFDDHAVCSVAPLRLYAARIPHGRDDVPGTSLRVVPLTELLA